MRKTLIIGASTNPERYSFKAAKRLIDNKHSIEMIGRREDMLFDKQISKTLIPFTDIDTVTLYISAKHQPEYYDHILSLKPLRVIFNPGTENPELQTLLDHNKIEWEQACTLVLLATNSY